MSINKVTVPYSIAAHSPDMALSGQFASAAANVLLSFVVSGLGF